MKKKKLDPWGSRLVSVCCFVMLALNQVNSQPTCPIANTNMGAGLDELCFGVGSNSAGWMTNGWWVFDKSETPDI